MHKLFFKHTSFTILVAILGSILITSTSFAIEKAITHDKFIILTPPKAGTHLITKVLSLIVEKKTRHYGQYERNPDNILRLLKEAEYENCLLDTHNVTPEIIQKLHENGYKIISIMRDPRDQLLSILNWILEGYWPQLPLHQLTTEEQIDELILGTRLGWKAFDWCYIKTFSMPLILDLPSDFAYITRFERLVGPRGGGNQDEQILEIINIANHIGVDITVETAEEIGEKAFGGTWTFRGGKIGKWKLQFTEKNKENYKQVHGITLINWEYENDFDW